MDISNSKYRLFENLTKSKVVIYTVYLMLFSYFYNLPVLKYSIKGDNEFRLFDIVGLLVLFIYAKNYNKINQLINNEKSFLYLHYFLQWTTFTWIFTLIFSIAFERLSWALQSLLYLYHFWVFYLTAVFLVIIIQDIRQLKRIVSTFLVFSILTFLVVILQNFAIMPFLWDEAYFEAYGFLSGTLGPNKIVLGMSCLFTFAMSIGLLNDKRVKINKLLLVVAVSISLITLVMSGSRTSYVALLVFVIVFMILKVKNFIYSAIALVFLITLISVVNSEVLDKALEVYQNRVENRVKNPNDFKEANIDGLYEDLGAGRKGLSIMYVEYLMENPLYIPFGIGFNNRLLVGSSAHNMYLSLINEVGLVGFFLYFRWLVYYLFVDMKQFPLLRTALVGLVMAMLVTLFFGEHLYAYRPLFGLFGLFMFVTTILLSPSFIIRASEINEKGINNQNKKYGTE